MSAGASPGGVTNIPSPAGNTVRRERQMLADKATKLTGVALVRYPRSVLQPLGVLRNKKGARHLGIDVPHHYTISPYYGGVPSAN